MQAWPPVDLDPECRLLCEAVNSLSGLRTYESCCGHGIHPFWVFFYARGGQAVYSLADLGFWLDKRHCGISGWHCELDAPEQTWRGRRRSSFLIVGPPGDYEGANEIASLIIRE